MDEEDRWKRKMHAFIGAIEDTKTKRERKLDKSLNRT